MAANDYYNTSYSASGALPPPHPPTHSESPLPPVPGSHSQQQGISPVTSPFDDANRYDYPSTTHLAHANTTSSSAYGDTSYHGADAHSSHGYNNRYDPPANHQSDPFGDHSAIPLQNQGKMGEGAPSAAVYGADPERRYPGEKSRKKKGWFSGRVTWVVYILTAVQVGVFVGEIIKNGMFYALQPISI
jgi:hypothetical protein